MTKLSSTACSNYLALISVLYMFRKCPAQVPHWCWSQNSALRNSLPGAYTTLFLCRVNISTVHADLVEFCKWPSAKQLRPRVSRDPQEPLAGGYVRAGVGRVGEPPCWEALPLCMQAQPCSAWAPHLLHVISSDFRSQTWMLCLG